MTPNQLPPLPEPDTHCFDDDTGKDVWSYTADQMHAYALAALAQQAQPVHQFRRRLCADWYDGHPDHEDGGGPYETRILYTTPQSPQHVVPVVSDEQIDPLVQKHARATWSGSQQDWDVAEFSRLGLVMFANAILALRPAVEPMTEWEIADIFERWDNTSGASMSDFVRMVEAHHGITAKAKGGA